MGAGGLQGASAGENQSQPPMSKPAADAMSAADDQVSIMRCAGPSLCREYNAHCAESLRSCMRSCLALCYHARGDCMYCQQTQCTFKHAGTVIAVTQHASSRDGRGDTVRHGKRPRRQRAGAA